MTITAQFFVSGMKCEGCVATAKEAINNVDGVQESSVDLSAGEASASGDFDPQAVCLALAEAGYPSVVKSG